VDRRAEHAAETIGVLQSLEDLGFFDEEFELGFGLHDDKEDAPEKYETKQVRQGKKGLEQIDMCRQKTNQERIRNPFIFYQGESKHTTASFY
jgi:hypothetical protein